MQPIHGSAGKDVFCGINPVNPGGSADMRSTEKERLSPILLHSTESSHERSSDEANTGNCHYRTETHPCR